jgi:glutamine amidotransferase
VPAVGIIDYGVGNLRSVEKAFEATGCNAVVSSDRDELAGAERLVLPGVGAFRACMSALSESGLESLVRERVSRGVPLLGVCVGMQMLFEKSEEFGSTSGLGFLRGSVKRFPEGLLAPQVGWNQVTKPVASALLDDIEDGSFFYFVHSFFCKAEDRTDVVGETEYGSTYASVVARGNISGVQFHPEKSQSAGLKLLHNFATGNV